MKKYLLDTNICVYFLNGKYDLANKIDLIGFESCSVSEVTIAELKYGSEKSSFKEKNRKIIESFQLLIDIIPIFPALDVYAKEKARLKTKGMMLDDFDLLIGATAIYNEMILVTKNKSDFERMEKIEIEDWTEIR